MKKFTFWKNNLIAGKHELGQSQVQEQFKAWLPKREISWLNYYSSDRIIRDFLASSDGISSTYEESQYDDIYTLLKPLYMDYMSKQKAEGWEY